MKLLFDRESWREVYETIKKNKVRTLITIIGVFWGLFLLVTLLGAARGLENAFNSQFGGFATNSLFVWAQSTEKPFKGYKVGRRLNLKMSDVKKIKQSILNIEFVIPRNQNQANLVRGTNLGNITINGDYPALDLVQKHELIYGRFLNNRDIEKKRKVIVISDDIYKQFFEVKEYPIGLYLKVNNINFKVIGVFKERRSGGPSSDANIPFTTFQQLFNTGQNVSWMMITAKKEGDIVEMEEGIKQLLRTLHKVHPEDGRAFGSFNLGNEYKKIIGFITGLQFLTWFVGIATLIAGVFAIGNILLITVKERTKEIGVRRALGATPSVIKTQVIMEAIIFSWFAGMLGIIVGGLILMLLDVTVGKAENTMIVNPSVSIPVVFLALFLLTLFSSLIGLIPANRAIKIKPIEALRTE